MSCESSRCQMSIFQFWLYSFFGSTRHWGLDVKIVHPVPTFIHVPAHIGAALGLSCLWFICARAHTATAAAGLTSLGAAHAGRIGGVCARACSTRPEVRLEQLTGSSWPSSLGPQCMSKAVLRHCYYKNLSKVKQAWKKVNAYKLYLYTVF